MTAVKDIPKDWKWVKLGEVCKLKNGFAFKNSEYRKDGIPIIRISDINGGNVKSINSVRVTSKEMYEEYLIESDDILVAMSGATTGKFGIFKSNEKVYQNQRVGKFQILDHKKLDNQFLLRQLHSLKRQIEKNAYGGAQPNISSKKIEEMQIALPPLKTQQRIVTKIEELFTQLDKSIEQLKTAQQLLKTYHQNLLNYLINGEAKATIESVIEKLDQGWSPKCHNEASSNNKEWAVIKTTAIQSGHFQDIENKRLPENLLPRKQHEIKKGDLLITRAGPRVRVGICCLVRETRPNLLNCDKVYRMRINPKIAIPEYIELILNSRKYSREIEKMKTGISDSGVNLTQKGFIKILIPVPPIKEQQIIVDGAENKLSVCSKLEETITQNLQQAEVLRQSILKQAFEGELII